RMVNDYAERIYRPLHESDPGSTVERTRSECESHCQPFTGDFGADGVQPDWRQCCCYARDSTGNDGCLAVTTAGWERNGEYGPGAGQAHGRTECRLEDRSRSHAPG